jgi:hypothetical protein
LDSIVLIHGFAASPCWMKPLGWRLASLGFRVLYWSYPSLFGAIETHSRNLHTYLQQLGTTDVPVHLVAHSMGSLIVRHMLSQIEQQSEESSRLHCLSGRSVFLAPPSRGTPMARYAGRVLGGIFPAVPQMSDASGSFANQLPALSCQQIGIIAARYDPLVPISQTRLPLPCQHTVITGTHNSILLQSKTAQLTTAFLLHGEFSRIPLR